MAEGMGEKVLCWLPKYGKDHQTPRQTHIEWADSLQILERKHSTVYDFARLWYKLKLPTKGRLYRKLSRQNWATTIVCWRGMHNSTKSHWTTSLYPKDRKLQNLIIQPELRWWENARFDGHFFGVHFVWGNYHVANVISDRLVKLNNYPVGVKGYVNNNWEGSMLGGGVSYGYYWPLRHNWGVEASMGIGYIHFDTKKYRSETPKPDKASCTNYFGLTKLSVAVVYTIK